MRARVATVLLGGMTSIAAACEGPAVLTARRQVELTAEPSIGSFASGGEIVVGSRVCPRMGAVRESDDPVRFVDADEPEIAACYALGVEGPGIFDEDGCLVVVARAADGTVLRRPRARWSKLDGPGQLDAWDREEEPREYAQVTDACEGAQAGEWRQATLQAQIGPLTDAAAVRWQCVEGDAPGCGCRAPGGGGLTWLWGLLLVAIPRGRRRRSSG